MFNRFNYKERPDLQPDAPKKNGFFRFWEIYIRKFWRLTTVNLLYFVITLPLIVFLYVTLANYLLSTTVIERYLILSGFEKPGVAYKITLSDSDERVLYEGEHYSIANHESELNQIKIDESDIGVSIFDVSMVSFDDKPVPSEGVSIAFSYDIAYDLIPGMKFYAFLFLNFLPSNLYYALAILSAILYGPAMMGATYVYRNFAREEHAWVSDFISRGWSNFAQGLIFGVIDLVILASLTLSATGMLVTGTDVMSTAVKTIARIGLIVYAFARHYIFLQAVTIKLSIGQILMNALRFVVLGFVKNIIAIVGYALATFVLLMLIPYSALLTLPFLFYSLTGFITVFSVYPTVKKYIIDPATPAPEPDETEDEEDEL